MLVDQLHNILEKTLKTFAFEIETDQISSIMSISLEQFFYVRAVLYLYYSFA